MSDIAIRVEHLGKQYRLGGKQAGYRTFREALLDSFAAPLRWMRGERKSYETFWALDDVSFEIKQGQAVGIVGRNGAGKSTLLKILSRITKPTKGRVDLYGRVASLLEVGTGFHGELSGRDNIYLNGAILGMSRREINRKFEEIIDFAGVEKFLDTPVKYYSSGMYVRLAFAVAAHLEPEILVVDEVLAVGDAEFQKKCLGKMGEVASEGRTVLFVSHNMGAVEQLCSSGILLEQGKLTLSSNSIKEVVRKYVKPEVSFNKSIWENKEKKYYSEYFYINKFYLTDEDGNILSDAVDNAKDFYVVIEFEVDAIDLALEIIYEVHDDEHRLVYWSQHTDTSEDKWPKIKKGPNILRTKIPRRFLNEGLYHIKAGASLRNRVTLLDPAKHNVSVILNIIGGLSDSPYWHGRRRGILAPVFEWETAE